MTCDCDGKIDRFIDLHDEKRTLPLHELHEDEDYILGAFLVGAYQETLGDLHNLMGDTNVVSVRLSESGELQFSREIEGDSVADVLTYVEYDPKEMFSRFRDNAERAVAEGRLRPEDRRIIVEAYRQSMQGYTYFEKA
jgi:arginine decarboxylase